MTQEFEMTDIGLMSYYLGIEVKQLEEGIFISQERYTREILKKFNMINSKPVTTPIETETKLSKHEEGDDVDPSYFKSLIGSLRYLTCTRLDILFSVGLATQNICNFSDSRVNQRENSGNEGEMKKMEKMEK
ncbi:putative mitochondrial protein [Cucumis melo var. makuwa]|uniref:Mitochondrial protein n=1 Tax=Cucumis melo var. makuwa TaxID=1194695 RepID=A0A5D3D366_CUCMM|nr:putative mitochondrial protein [Cucumis melo var. makuwa]TYK17894.1 putative mitochondrial protein [Cucumis melo var. makuwa]